MNIHDLLIKDLEVTPLEDVFMSQSNRDQLRQLLKEQHYSGELANYGLPINNKIILYGSSGCGKTLCAKAIAHSLNKPLIIMNLSTIIHARIGETSQLIKQIFDKATRENAVLFLDEFDQIGKTRGGDQNDVGEMRRLVNTLIQLIDYFSTKSLLICATNHMEIIDHALLRRFQLRIHFNLPTQQELNLFYQKLLLKFPINIHPVELLYGVSYAEAKDYCYTEVKANLIKDLDRM